MTLGFYLDYTELFRGAVLHWTGVDETITGFPILPAGVTVTPNGTWNTSDLGTNKFIKNFSGTQYITLLDDAAWDFYNSNFTISLWFKTSNISADEYIYAQYASAAERIRFWWVSSTNSFVITHVNASAITFSYSIPAAISNNVWYHITLQRFGNTCIFYLDGVQLAVTITTAFTTTVGIAAGLTLGRYNTSNLSGNIKDFMIQTNALSQSEIIALMRLTHPTTGPGLLPLISPRGNE